MGLREEKKRRVHGGILRVSEQLFRARGFDETTIDEITRRVGISRQTFFNYFPGKEAVLTELGFQWLQGQMTQGVAATGREGARPRGVLSEVRRGIRAQLAAIEADRDFMRLVFTRSGVMFPTGPQANDKARLERTRRLFRGVAQVLRVAQEAGEIRRDVDPLQAAEIYSAVTLITIRLWLTDYWEETGSLEDRVMTALDVIMNGLASR